MTPAPGEVVAYEIPRSADFKLGLSMLCNNISQIYKKNFKFCQKILS